MLSSDGAVKIADFGISSQLANTAAFCESFVGTTCYMSPERLAGEAYSYPADVWALGMIVLELASGAYPYPTVDASYFSLLGRIMDEPPPQLPKGRGFSEALSDFIANCLDKEPNLRPSANDLLKHPWLRQHREPPPMPPRAERLSSGSSVDLRRDGSAHSLERSRSRLKDDLKDLKELESTLDGISLGGGGHR